jgi:alpha-tubulin suppressor-like RCC1 family protein
VTLGQEHACAAYDAPGVEGAVRCWGRGSEGQLGHGAAPGIQRTAVEVVDAALAPLSGVVGIAAGSWHSCAVTGAGEVWCWGGSASRSTAAPVGGLGPAAAIVSGESHTCALVVGGGGSPAPWCWGSNHLGQLGDGTRDSRDAPGPVVAF